MSWGLDEVYWTSGDGPVVAKIIAGGEVENRVKFMPLPSDLYLQKFIDLVGEGFRGEVYFGIDEKRRLVGLEASATWLSKRIQKLGPRIGPFTVDEVFFETKPKGKTHKLLRLTIGTTKELSSPKDTQESSLHTKGDVPLVDAKKKVGKPISKFEKPSENSSPDKETPRYGEGHKYGDPDLKYGSAKYDPPSPDPPFIPPAGVPPTASPEYMYKFETTGDGEYFEDAPDPHMQVDPPYLGYVSDPDNILPEELLGSEVPGKPSLPTSPSEDHHHRTILQPSEVDWHGEGSEALAQNIFAPKARYQSVPALGSDVFLVHGEPKSNKRFVVAGLSVVEGRAVLVGSQRTVEELARLRDSPFMGKPVYSLEYAKDGKTLGTIVVVVMAVIDVGADGDTPPDDTPDHEDESGGGARDNNDFKNTGFGRPVDPSSVEWIGEDAKHLAVTIFDSAEKYIQTTIYDGHWLLCQMETGEHFLLSGVNILGGKVVLYGTRESDENTIKQLKTTNIGLDDVKTCRYQYSEEKQTYASQIQVVTLSADTHSALLGDIKEEAKKRGAEVLQLRHVPTHKQLQGRDMYASKAQEPDPHSLDLGTKSEVLRDLMLSDDKTGGFTVGLFGAWGVGKTTLANRTASLLKGDGYETIAFNAWKYRGKPYTWIALHEQFVEAIKKKKHFDRFALSLRANLAAHGMGSINTFLLVSACALMLSLYRGYLAYTAFTLFGIAVIFFLVSLFRSVIVPGIEVWKKYTLISSYRSELGMQVTLGDSLKHLLCGWIPQKVAELDLREEDQDAPPPYRDYWDGLNAWHFAFAGLLLSFTLSPISSDIAYHLFGYQDPLFPSIRWVLALAVLVFCLIFLRFIGYRQLADKRLLLIVEDLDRCHTDDLLEVMESICVLLDDPEIQKRLQVMMLVDHDVLDHAVRERFKGLVQEDIPNNETENAARQEIPVSVRKCGPQYVREHVEKLFVATYRIPALSEEDLSDLIEVEDASVDISPTSIQRDDGDSMVLTKNIGIGESAPVAVQGRQEGKPAEEDKSEKDSEPIHLSAPEKLLIRNALAVLFKNYPTNRWGPRFVRSFEFRYMLGRELLRRLEGSQEGPNEDLINGMRDYFVGRHLDHSKLEDLENLDPKLHAVIESIM